MMRRALFAALMASVIVAAVAPTPVAAASSTTTFTLSTVIPEGRDAASAWSKNTGATIVLGACTGPRCIRAEVVDVTGCSGMGSLFASDAGCAITQADGSCVAQVRSMVPLFYGTLATRAVLEHEVGHCLGLGHSSEAKSVMHTPMDLADPPRQPTRQDRANLRALLP